jgi:hydrogenase maturation protease
MSELADQRGVGPKVVVACLGNPDRGDDAVGVMVGQRLSGRLSDDVTLLIRSGDVLSLIEDWVGFDALVCVDAAAPMGTPGRIHRFDMATDGLPRNASLTSCHAFSLVDAIRLARIIWRAPHDIIVYAVEGRCFDAGAPMTDAVAAAASEVARRVTVEVGDLLQGRKEPISRA